MISTYESPKAKERRFPTADSRRAELQSAILTQTITPVKVVSKP